jgi:hypothetical protein
MTPCRRNSTFEQLITLRTISSIHLLRSEQREGATYMVVSKFDHAGG